MANGKLSDTCYSKMQILNAISNRLPEKETVNGEKAYKHEMIIMLMIMKFITKCVVLNENKTCV